MLVQAYLIHTSDTIYVHSYKSISHNHQLSEEKGRKCIVKKKKKKEIEIETKPRNAEERNESET